MNQLQPNRIIQIIAIFLVIIQITLVFLGIFDSAAGFSASNIAALALPSGLLLLMLADYPRFKMTIARIPLLAIGGVLGLLGLYFVVSNRLS